MVRSAPLKINYFAHALFCLFVSDFDFFTGNYSKFKA